VARSCGRRMSGFPLLLGGKQTFGELPQNDAHDPEQTRTGVPRVGCLDAPVRTDSRMLAVTFCGARPCGCCDGSQPECEHSTA
jgi:hypothetical protein